MAKIRNQGMGPIGFCICRKCGYRKIHQVGIPCREEQCPKCGMSLKREDLLHHIKIKTKESR
jgi:rubrerythrin